MTVRLANDFKSEDYEQKIWIMNFLKDSREGNVYSECSTLWLFTLNFGYKTETSVDKGILRVSLLSIKFFSNRDFMT